MNAVHIIKTKFKNVKDKECSYGYRMYNEFGISYCNIMTESDMQLSELEFITKIVDGGYLRDEEKEMLYGSDKKFVDGVEIALKNRKFHLV